MRKAESALAEKLREADERRRAAEVERIRKLTEISGHNRIEKVGLVKRRQKLVKYVFLVNIICCFL